jgi:hypothetical protein
MAILDCGDSEALQEFPDVLDILGDIRTSIA